MAAIRPSLLPRYFRVFANSGLRKSSMFQPAVRSSIVIHLPALRTRTRRRNRFRGKVIVRQSLAQQFKGPLW